MDRKTKQHNSTTALFQKLNESPDLLSFFIENSKELKTPSFSETIQTICNEKKMVPEPVILQSGIERTYGHQLFNGTRKPSRDKVIQLAFGLKLDLESTQNLLKIAQKSQLYPKIRRDAAVIFCINRQLDFFDTQSLLQSLEITLLGQIENHG